VGFVWRVSAEGFRADPDAVEDVQIRCPHQAVNFSALTKMPLSMSGQDE
jgi:hypothetical protein